MFGIGAPELIIILVLALIIVGPQKLPELGRTLGQTMSAFKAQTDELRSVMSFDATSPATPPAGVSSHFPVTGPQAYGAAAEQFLATGRVPASETDVAQSVTPQAASTSYEAKPVAVADTTSEAKQTAI